MEVGDKDKVGPGGGLVEEGDMINVVEMSVSEVREYISRWDKHNLDSQYRIQFTISGIKLIVLLDFCLEFNGIYKIDYQTNKLYANLLFRFIKV